jgi:hypothetical protein
MQNFCGPSAGEANIERVAVYAPWCPHAFRISSAAVAPWVRGYRKNVHYFYPPWQFLDIDIARRRKG